MSKQMIKAVRGMNDLYGQEGQAYNRIVKLIETTLSSHGYDPVYLPIVEKTELFARSIGAVTDIVEKEMYTFDDRNDEKLTLRPEGTAGCVRAMIENGLLYNQVQKVFYIGPMFRYERPQKGRYRQFNQFGVEIFGIDAVEAEAELIAITHKLWLALGISKPELQINSLGDKAARAEYRDLLVAYFNEHLDALDEDSLRRLKSNPLRILDSKNPSMVEVIKNAPKLLEHLDVDSKLHFETLKQYLDALNIDYVVNSNLVRGLDYYNRSVFEWVTTELGAQGTICAGGRYDGLVEQIGGKPTPAVGFAIGLERVMALFMDKTEVATSTAVDIYMVLLGDMTKSQGLVLANDLRTKLVNVSLKMNLGGGGAKAQFKKADRSMASIAIVLGEEEVNNKTVVIKYLREDKPQETIKQSELASVLLGFFK